jgi:hypothetical protein
MATFIHRIAFRSSAKKHLSHTEYSTFSNCAKQHLSVAIIPLKIAFLKCTDRCFFHVGIRKATHYSVNVAYIYPYLSGTLFLVEILQRRDVV